MQFPLNYVTATQFPLCQCNLHYFNTIIFKQFMFYDISIIHNILHYLHVSAVYIKLNVVSQSNLHLHNYDSHSITSADCMVS